MTQRMKRTLALLLVAIMTFGTLIYSSTSVTAEEASDLKNDEILGLTNSTVEEASDVKNENIIDSKESRAKEDSDLKSEKPIELVDSEAKKEARENIVIKENLAKDEGTDENREAATEKSDAEGNLKATLSGDKLNPSSVTLEERKSLFLVKFLLQSYLRLKSL